MNILKRISVSKFLIYCTNYVDPQQEHCFIIAKFRTDSDQVIGKSRFSTSSSQYIKRSSNSYQNRKTGYLRLNATYQQVSLWRPQSDSRTEVT